MARQLRKTLIDYLVIAISPALIMTLVGSLVFFLIEVFYQGNFQGRLQYIFALFVMAAVLIGRISIEEGRERAVLFAVPLGIAILLAINKFVEFQGAAVEALSFVINFGLIALVWWSADKLTWDCTLIDEDEEDSGEGLLEAVGLDRPDKAALQEEITPLTPETGGDHLAGGSTAGLVGTVRRAPPPTARARRLGHLLFAGRTAAVRDRPTLHSGRKICPTGSMRSNCSASTRPAGWACC